jgi:acetoin utilization protein AcuA
MVLDHPLKEARIFYMVGYSWTWDLDGSLMAAMDYREMMIHLFSVFGFEVLQTNEPNVLLRPENLFMARIGKNISEANQKRFKQVRFNLDL